MVTANLTEAPLALPTCSIRLTDLIGTKKPTGGHSLTSREVPHCFASESMLWTGASR
ncbi:BQ5605_C005g03409 [Microbotryum silenes-dioicae]|uniref:BQ5605_C005g03409 protein n=1 Tax=Microbotryum silenes-dioicae TaxID=796604 RepID=A0A2X0MES2_9BASI|nr:BQ5605_C005g03409 [Microbotryum silenes-dioicae]